MPELAFEIRGILDLMVAGYPVCGRSHGRRYGEALPSLMYRDRIGRGSHGTFLLAGR